MADRSERVQIISDTLRLCREHRALEASVRASVRGQVIYWESGELPLSAERRWEHTELVISADRTLGAAGKYAAAGKKVCILNFASSVTPGGGVLRGAAAQEESICRICTLYPALADSGAGMFYTRHREAILKREMGRENRDDCIYTPCVTVFREDTFGCELMKEENWFSVDVITCAAPDLRCSPGEIPFRPSPRELSELFERRWKRILTVAANHGADVLILGAFGCGVFGNPPELAAGAAGKARAAFDGYFETIEFAVFSQEPEGANYKAFAGIGGIRRRSRPSDDPDGSGAGE